MVGEFRDFVLRGNIVELAVAFVIATAFTGVVGSFTSNILFPVLTLFGLPDLGDLNIITPGGAVISYGVFLNSVIAFLIIAALLFFLLVKPMNALEARRQAGMESPPTTKTCTECASEIPIVARRCPSCTQPHA